MRWGLLLATFIMTAGCGVAQQPESARAVAAFEILLPTEKDRNEFLTLLSAVAQAEGLYVYSESRDALLEKARVHPNFEMTIHAGVWRGVDDAMLEATVMDWHDRLGQAWITFLRGEDPALAYRFREEAMRKIRMRWPETVSLPIMPSGAIPLWEDLILTATGYIVDPAAASKYELKDSKQRLP